MRPPLGFPERAIFSRRPGSRSLPVFPGETTAAARGPMAVGPSIGIPADDSAAAAAASAAAGGCSSGMPTGGIPRLPRSTPSGPHTSREQQQSLLSAAPVPRSGVGNDGIAVTGNSKAHLADRNKDKAVTDAIVRLGKTITSPRCPAPKKKFIAAKSAPSSDGSSRISHFPRSAAGNTKRGHGTPCRCQRRGVNI